VTNRRVDLYRDSYGIPHIRARTAEDAFFAQGYAAAQDRLWQMAYDRCRAYGRWAEWVGPSGAHIDRFQRRFRIEASVLRDFQAADEEPRAMLVSYADGVNTAIAAMALPPEFSILGVVPDPWQPWDCLAVLRVRHMAMGSYERKLWRWRVLRILGPAQAARAFPDLPEAEDALARCASLLPDDIVQALDAVVGEWTPAPTGGLDAGSNSWALSGKRTASGKPILAGDPHRTIEVPNVYYQNHIACPKFDAIGLSFPGCPGFPHFGHNAHVAWAVTHATADTQDLYVERLVPGDPPLYSIEGRWQPASTYLESIGIAGTSPEILTVIATRHGPIILGGPEHGVGLALQEATRRFDTTPGAMRRMLEARSADELERSMEQWCDPVNNLVFADRSGDIRLLVRGRIPVRDRTNAWALVPGWTGDHEWQGFIPFEALPRIRNPVDGMIVNANNRAAPDDYPYHISLSYAADFRARRITERLRTTSDATAEDMAALHGDVVSLPARAYLARLRSVRWVHPEAKRAWALMADWDGAMEPGLVAPTVYRAFRDALDHRVVRELLGPLADAMLSSSGRGPAAHFRALSAWLLDTTTTDGKGMGDGALQDALVEGVARLRERFGDDPRGWVWGEVHTVRPAHALTQRLAAVELDHQSIPMPGDADTVNVGAYSQARAFAVTTVPVARYVFDLGNWEASGWVVPLGVSGRPGHRHADDQTPVWAHARLVPMLYGWERIEKESSMYEDLSRAENLVSLEP
jgi:penicillin amidase